MTPQHRYLPVLYRGAFDSYSTAKSSMGTTAEEIARFVEGAKATGESAIIIYMPIPAKPAQLESLFQVRPGIDRVTPWVADRGYATDTKDEADAFMERTNSGAVWFVSPVLVAAGGRHA